MPRSHARICRNSGNSWSIWSRQAITLDEVEPESSAWATLLQQTLASHYPAQSTGVEVVRARRAMLPPEVDDLQVQLVPALFREGPLQVLLRLHNVLAAGQAPAVSEAVDVCIHREGGLAEGLGDADGSGLVADAG